MITFLFFLCVQSLLASTITDNIKQTVNQYIEDLTPSEITMKIELNFQLLGMIDSNGDWVHTYFKTYPNGFSLL